MLIKFWHLWCGTLTYHMCVTLISSYHNAGVIIRIGQINIGTMLNEIFDDIQSPCK